VATFKKLMNEIETLRSEYHSLFRELSTLRRNLWIQDQLRSRAKTNRSLCLEFENVKYVAGGCFGLVMSCDLPLLGQRFSFALKMIRNLGEKTCDVEKRCFCEFMSLKSLFGLHPNIIVMIHSFSDKPTEQMVSFIDESVRDLATNPDNTLKFPKTRLLIWTSTLKIC
jgi:hypothetical protein